MSLGALCIEPLQVLWKIYTMLGYFSVRQNYTISNNTNSSLVAVLDSSNTSVSLQTTFWIGDTKTKICSKHKSCELKSHTILYCKVEALINLSAGFT